MAKIINSTLDNIKIGVDKVINENKKLKEIINEIESLVDYNYFLYGHNANENLMQIRKLIKEFKYGTNKMQ